MGDWDAKMSKEQLLRAIENRLAPCGYRRGQHDFVKSREGGKVCLHLAFIDHAQNFDCTADVAVRFDELEEVVQGSNKLLSAKEKKNTYSLGVELGNLSEGKQKRWRVDAETHVSVLAERIVGYFQLVGIPYFDKYVDVDSAFSVFSGDTSECWLHSAIDGERAKRAVCIAWLRGDTDLFERIVESKEKFLIERDDFGLNGFRRFVETLRKRKRSAEG